MSTAFTTLPLDCFPTQLLGWQNRPKAIWYTGDISLLDLPLVSVVGSRDISPEGVARTEKLTKLLISYGACVVSGMAEGVDEVAHRTALRTGGKTIAVMGTPINKCYPRKHLMLKHEIETTGLVLSQFPPGSPVQPSNFPRRNELMAALSMMTIVVEAKASSGTRHQVKKALDLNRPVGFLASLARRDVPWIQEALSAGLGFLIASPSDLAEHVMPFTRSFNPSNKVLAERVQAAAEVEQLNLFKDIPMRATSATHKRQKPLRKRQAKKRKNSTDGCGWFSGIV